MYEFADLIESEVDGGGCVPPKPDSVIITAEVVMSVTVSACPDLDDASIYDAIAQGYAETLQVSMDQPGTKISDILVTCDSISGRAATDFSMQFKCDVSIPVECDGDCEGTAISAAPQVFNEAMQSVEEAVQEGTFEDDLVDALDNNLNDLDVQLEVTVEADSFVPPAPEALNPVIELKPTDVPSASPSAAPTATVTVATTEEQTSSPTIDPLFNGSSRSSVSVVAHFTCALVAVMYALL